MIFAGDKIYFNKSMNNSVYADLVFKERIAAVPSMIHFTIWGKEEHTEFNNFITKYLKPALSDL